MKFCERLMLFHCNNFPKGTLVIQTLIDFNSVYFRGLIHKGIMYKTFIMENCYLFYLIRNLLKQNHRTAYGIMFLGVSRLRIAATIFYMFLLTYSIQVASLFTCLFHEWKWGLKKVFVLDGLLSHYLCNLGQAP